ncbi:MAG: hypothetical protein ACI399_07565 [Candidatus Cryptobacteroides sp.]
MSVDKGDSVTVSWTSELPDSLVLVIDDGETVQRVQVPDSGSRVCWSNRATKNMVFTLVATTGTRKESTTVKVKVRGAGKSGRSSGGVGRFQLWKEKMQASFSVARAQFKYSWAAMKTWQKVLYAALWAMPVVLFLILVF